MTEDTLSSGGGSTLVNSLVAVLGRGASTSAGGISSRNGGVCRSVPRTGGEDSPGGRVAGLGGGEWGRVVRVDGTEGSGGGAKSKVGSGVEIGDFSRSVAGTRRRPVRSSAWSRPRIVSVRNACNCSGS